MLVYQRVPKLADVFFLYIDREKMIQAQKCGLSSSKTEQ